MHIEALFEGGQKLAERIAALPGSRSLVAVAGPPGAGKSLLASHLVDSINELTPGSAAVIPVDGFHYDDAVLSDWGLLARKGAPNTFDVGGLAALLGRLRGNAEPFVAVPVFDRNLEIARAGGRVVPQSVRYLIVEGNYLLLRTEPWSTLAAYFDLTAMIREDQKLLERRLLDRWIDHGYPLLAANQKVVGNDMLNVGLVLSDSRLADLIVRASSQNFEAAR